ncbi:MAG: QueT transporter family protein [Clostridia bacterium]|nr:QueT transporter family protein [Clostridia bacterium]
MKKGTLRGITTASAISAIYVILTLFPGISVLSFGPLQARISEVLCVLPVFTPWAIPGLAVGCFVSNMLGSVGVADMIFGTLATLIASGASYYLRKYPLGISLIPPVLFNGIIVGSMLTFVYMNGSKTALIYNILTVSAGEMAVCYLLALPFGVYLKKHSNIFNI